MSYPRGSNFGAAEAGRLLLALGFVVVGALGLAVHDFVLSQEPVPKDVPWREALACASGVVSLVAGAGLLLTPVARLSALTLTAFVSLWVLLLLVPRLVAHPLVEAFWLGLGEDLTLVAGSWAVFCSITRRSDATLLAARAIFGIALVPIGLSHFFYLKTAVDLIPTWMPWRSFLTQFTGAAHIAAGLGILCGVIPRLAAPLEALMESLFTVIVWGAAVISVPASRESWVNLCISTALSAAAWAIAGSYRREAPLVSHPVRGPDVLERS